ncbi:Uncharacterised protein [Streptococcus pneumoniae]|nr:Uncharacterised protein [Streptococcus pneumoniae]
MSLTMNDKRVLRLIKVEDDGKNKSLFLAKN